jgi:hypothetical protein
MALRRSGLGPVCAWATQIESKNDTAGTPAIGANSMDVSPSSVDANIEDRDELSLSSLHAEMQRY